MPEKALLIPTGSWYITSQNWARSNLLGISVAFQQHNSAPDYCICSQNLHSSRPYAAKGAVTKIFVPALERAVRSLTEVPCLRIKNARQAGRHDRFLCQLIKSGGNPGVNCTGHRLGRVPVGLNGRKSILYIQCPFSVCRCW